MYEKQKNIWSKSWKLPGSFLGWLLLVTGSALLISVLGALIIDGMRIKEDLGIIVAVTTVAIAVAIIFLLIRWSSSRRNFKRFLFGLACFATLVALFYAEEDWRGRYNWEKFKRERGAKGEKFDWLSVVPPPVPDDQNFALTPIVFTSYGFMLGRDGKEIPHEHRDTNFVQRMNMSVAHNNYLPATNGMGDRQSARLSDLIFWQKYYRTLAATTNEFPTALLPQTPAQDVLLALSKYDSNIEELMQASQLPYSRFPLNYDSENPSMIFLPHLAALKYCAELLQLRAIAELQNGESEKALNDVKLTLRLVDSISAEPFLISHLVRIAMMNLALQPVWEGLAEHQWSDAQLVELDQILAKLDLLVDYGVAMRGERGLGIGVVDFLQHNRRVSKLAEFSDFESTGYLKPSTMAIIYRLSPSGWFDQNKLRIAQFETRWYLPLADIQSRTVSPKSTQSASDALDKEIGTLRSNPYNWLEKILMPGLSQAVIKFASAQISADMARVATALERYRLANGEYPQFLDALAPKFIAQVPHDIIGGEPLKYRRTSDGQFILYSVGWNEKDDGGVVGYHKGSAAPNFQFGDWVWRYPAK